MTITQNSEQTITSLFIAFLKRSLEIQLRAIAFEPSNAKKLFKNVNLFFFDVDSFETKEYDPILKVFHPSDL